MRLVLREYLSMLKESGELDALLPDLLLAMGLDPLSRPGRGPRQFGVDLPAVGIDPEDGKLKLFLFLVKQGDITRSGWDTGEQAVRPSLNEVFDTYLRSHVRPEHNRLPKKIVLVTSGELKQNVQQNWTGYASERVGFHSIYGEIELEFWGADKLALLLEKYLVNEYLFPESSQKQIRKTIALADQNENEPRHFYALIDDSLFNRELTTEKTAGADRKRKHVLRLLNLSTNIVFHWCREAGNLRPALLCAERLLLRVWDWMRQWQMFDKSTQEEFSSLFNTFLTVVRAYMRKIHPHCLVRDGLFAYASDELEYRIRTFELIGILGELGMVLAYQVASSDDDETSRSLFQEGAAVIQTLASLIENNPSALTPCFDEHSIDIGLGLLAFTAFGANGQAAAWVVQLGLRTVFSFRLGRHFPVSSDSYDDLVALKFDEGVSGKELMQLSTLVPLLADWFAVLELQGDYGEFRKAVVNYLANTNLQMWFPDEGTEEVLYRSNAAFRGGTVLDSILLPERLNDLRARIVRLWERSVFEKLSCIEKGWPILGLIASRHFRTPLMPEYWQMSMTPIPDPSGIEDPRVVGS